jgi:hypothetical protein
LPTSDSSIGQPTVGSRTTKAKLSCNERSGPTGAFARRLGSGLETKMAWISARNDSALRVTRPPTPMGPIRKPPIMGPTNWATLKAIEFRPMALTIARAGTRRGYTVWRVAPSKAWAMADSTVKASTRPMVIRPVRVSQASTADTLAQ